MAATAHDLLRDPLKLQGQRHCSLCGHTIAHKHLREWLMNVPCCPIVAHGDSRPLSRWSTRFDRPAGNAWLSQIGLQAVSLVVRSVRLMGFLGSPKFEQGLVLANIQRQRKTSWLAWTRGSHRNLTSSGNLRTTSGASVRFGVWDPLGNAGRRPKDRAAAVRGHPHENPGRRPQQSR